MTDPDRRQRRSVAKVLVKVGYGLTALPVLIFTAFGFWALAKNNYRGEDLGPSIQFLPDGAGRTACLAHRERGRRNS